MSFISQPIEECFWDVARQYPLTAVKDPLYDLLILEDPGRWLALQEERAAYWVNQYVRELHPRWIRHFASDCVEYAMDHTVTDPNSILPLRAIVQVVKDYADDACTESDLDVAKDRHVAEYDSHGSVHDEVSRILRDMTIDLTYIFLPFLDSMCLEHVLSSARRCFPSSEFRHVAVWQWRRLLQYLQPKKESNP